jgi:hypothetical protein
MTNFDKRKIYASHDDDPLSKLSFKPNCRSWSDFIFTLPSPETTDHHFWKKKLVYDQYVKTFKYENSFSLLAWQSK